jgi:putative transcriptional regulator
MRTGNTLFVVLSLVSLAASAWFAPLSVSAPTWAYSDRVVEPARGVLLVAGEEMADPRFREAVVLVLEHSELGTVGIIINRRTDTELGALVPEFGAIDPQHRAIYLGGPIAGSGLVFLARNNTLTGSEAEVVDGVSLDDRTEVLETLLDAAADDRELRVYVGYCGWGPGQLAAELVRGDWHLVEGTANRIFASPPSSLWQRLIDLAIPQGLIVAIPRWWMPAT